MLRLTFQEIDTLIQASTFHETKALQILEIAHQTVQSHNGKLPCDEKVLRSFHGIGVKCTNLVLGIACAEVGIHPRCSSCPVLAMCQQIGVEDCR